MSEILQSATILSGVFVAVGGWLYNSWKEREFRKFELRTKYRLEMLEASLSAIVSINESRPTARSIIDAFTAARTKVGVFGSDDELREFERLIKVIESYAGRQLVGEDINTFPKLLVNNFRKEIGLPPRNHDLEPRD